MIDQYSNGEKMVELSWERLVYFVAGLGGLYLAILGLTGLDIVNIISSSNVLLARLLYFLVGMAIINTLHNWSNKIYRKN